jgi:hypothetical protein
MKLTAPTTELEPGPIAPQPVIQGPLSALLEWQGIAEGVFAEYTPCSEGGRDQFPGLLRVPALDLRAMYAALRR